MDGTGTPKKARPSTATIALAAAGLIAAASAGIAMFRSSDRAGAEAPPHGTITPDQPVASVEEKIAELEARMQQNPDNPDGWRMLGWSYFETGNLERSAAAYRRATEVEPGNAENWSSLGEALQSGTTEVSTAAEAAFRRALEIDSADPRARYFLALQKDLRGQHEAAIGDWIALLRDTPAGAPWEGDLRRTITETAQKQGINVAGRLPDPSPATPATASAGPAAGQAIPGPTAEQMAAAASLPAAQQDQMVRGMVDGLASRLKGNPRDATGWIRLMRARMVLGETDAASAALRSGLAAFRDDRATQAQLTQAAEELGVPYDG